MNILPLCYDLCDGSEDTERESSSHGIVTVVDGDDPLEELVHTGNLVQVEAALLEDPQHAHLEKVGALLEEVGQLHHAGVDEDGEGVLAEEVREPDDGLGLLSQLG